jgi:hypothetical protein
MFTTSKIKLSGTIILAGTLLVLALMGGNWGNNYSASASVNATPFIQSIIPKYVPIGSPDTPMIIYGLNFGTQADTKVRLTVSGITQELTPYAVSPNEIRLIIPANLLDAPAIYTVLVAIYVNGTIPGDMLSNPVTFVVFNPYIYCPLSFKYIP